MLIQWCLKGIPESSTFSDHDAKKALQDAGLASAWLRNPTGRDIRTLPSDSHASLSQNALNAHVNGFRTVAATTPYISLSAGCVEPDPGKTTPRVYPALETALFFATRNGTCSGYVFRLWVLVSPKPGPELPGFAEEVREFNLFKQFVIFHEEGEIAAKIFVPSWQIDWVEKYDEYLDPQWVHQNSSFVPPERISNVLEVI